MKSVHKNAIALGAAMFLLGTTAMPLVASADEAIPRAASTPNTPKNWAGPTQKIYAQTLVDEIAAGHPELMSITMHAVPPGGEKEAYTMIAGTFPDRIGNTSSPGDIITAKKGVTQVESKWGTPDYLKKVSIVVPLKDPAGNYLPVAMVLAFKKDAGDKRMDTDFMAPGVKIRDALNSRIKSTEALFGAAK